MKNKSDARSRPPQGWCSFRLSLETKSRAAEQAAMAGLSLSEYLRRRIVGGRPLIAHTDEWMIRELRRLGGLLKHNFETLREAGAGPEFLQRQEMLLRQLAEKIDEIWTAR
jgi:hypothetical protein